MNIKELIEILRSMGIPDTRYSLDGSLWPDRIVLYHNYSLWEVFYFDERGNRNPLRNFDNENDACEYILNILRQEQRSYTLVNSETASEPQSTDNNNTVIYL
jgi:hypothetical protein